MKITSEQIENFEDPASGKLKYLRPIIVLVPAFIVCVYDIYAKISFLSLFPALDAITIPQDAS